VVLSSTQLQKASVTLWFRRLQFLVKRTVLSVFIDLRYAECVCLCYGLRICPQTNKLKFKKRGSWFVDWLHSFQIADRTKPKKNTTEDDFKVPVKGPQTQTRIVGYPVDLATAKVNIMCSDNRFVRHMLHFGRLNSFEPFTSWYSFVFCNSCFFQALRNIVLGYSSQSFTTDWKKYHFTFREAKSKIPYGLDASLVSWLDTALSYLFESVWWNNDIVVAHGEMG